MRFSKLSQAIAMVNRTGFGLTSGLESLDDREQEEWKAGIRAGNLYINRSTVGAVVLRQPFGGMGKSAFGPGLKAGGPNYVTQFMNFTETDPSSAEPDAPPAGSTSGKLDQLLVDLKLPEGPCRQRLASAFADYQRWWEMEFSKTHDHFLLIGQDNQRRYLPLREVRIRVHPDDSAFDLFARVAAARTVGSRITVSSPPGWHSADLDRLTEATESWAADIEFVVESDSELAEVLDRSGTDRVRYALPERAPEVVRRAAARSQIHLADPPVLRHGRVELLWYLQEQSLSFDYHRYGNLGPRAGEERALLVQPEGVSK